MRRNHVASTLIRRHFYVMCPLGILSGNEITLSFAFFLKYRFTLQRKKMLPQESFVIQVSQQEATKMPPLEKWRKIKRCTHIISTVTVRAALPYFIGYKTGFISFRNHNKNLDPSYDSGFVMVQKVAVRSWVRGWASPCDDCKHSLCQTSCKWVPFFELRKDEAAKGEGWVPPGQ